MAKVVKTLKVIRNNWKKSVFGSGVLIYGVNYATEYYTNVQQMRKYCLEAMKIGDELLPIKDQARHITVILNPAANKRKAKTQFEKYCAPLLHLSGISVDILVTESAGQARTLAENLDSKTEAILVAGGDGTVSEVVTGLMRTNAEKCNLAIGVLPLGATNSLAMSLIGYSKVDGNHVTAQHLAEATMAVIQGQTKSIHSLKIQVLEDSIPKPVYSLSSIEWGAWRDAKSKKDKYWYYGPFRSYAAYLFNPPTAPYHGKLLVASPCDGCSKCYSYRIDLHTPVVQKRWWHAFLPSSGKSSVPQVDYMSIVNEKCGEFIEKELHTVDLKVLTPNVNYPASSVHVNIGPRDVSWTEYIAEGWRRERGEKAEPIEMLEAQHIEIKPTLDEKDQDCERWLSIDNEDYEVKPIKATLLYNSLRMFYRQLNKDTQASQHYNQAIA